MSYYKLGLALTPARPARAGVTIGLLPGFVGTDEALRELDLLDGEIKAAGKELFDAVDGRNLDDPLAAWYVTGAWQAFVKRWTALYEKDKAWWPRFVNPKDVFNKAQDFRKEYIQLRGIAASQLGMEWHGADPRAPIAPRSVADDLINSLGLAALLKYAALGILILGGFFLVMSLR